MSGSYSSTQRSGSSTETTANWLSSNRRTTFVPSATKMPSRSCSIGRFIVRYGASSGRSSDAIFWIRNVAIGALFQSQPRRHVKHSAIKSFSLSSTTFCRVCDKRLQTLVIGEFEIKNAEEIYFSFARAAAYCARIEMGLKLFNTLSRSVQDFAPLDPAGKKVGMYCCGPTVYDLSLIHI